MVDGDGCWDTNVDNGIINYYDYTIACFGCILTSHSLMCVCVCVCVRVCVCVCGHACRTSI